MTVEVGPLAESARLPMGSELDGWKRLESRCPSEAPREPPLDGTASLAGAIPMRPGQLQAFFRVFFLESTRDLVKKAAFLLALSTICSVYLLFIHESLSSQRLGFLALKSAHRPVAGCRISIIMESVQLPGRKSVEESVVVGKEQGELWY